jgi:peroxiredoxin
MTFRSITRRTVCVGIALCAMMLCTTAYAAPNMAADFSLTDLDGKVHTLSQYKGKVVVLEFFNPDCPFIKRAHTNKGFVETIKSAQAKGVVWLAINSNATGKQGSSVETNEAGRKNLGINFPILLNPRGTVGQAYGATRTPEMVLISAGGEIVYRGGVDSSGGSLKPKSAVTYWLKDALDAHIAGKPVANAVTKPWGCGVKY